MKTLFQAYLRPTDEQFERLWRECIFVFDANTLLSLYRWSRETRGIFLKIVKGAVGRVWLPHQCAKEFFEIRVGELAEQRAKYDEFLKMLEDKVVKPLEHTRAHPFVSSDLLKKIKVLVEEIKAEFAGASQTLAEDAGSDPILTDVLSIFDGKVGLPFKPEETAALFVEGDKRYAAKIPPGYMDASKPSDRKYGDLIFWQQMINKAKSEKKPAILVTEDGKEDWWLKHDGKTIGPRPELRAEFFDKTGQHFFAYAPGQFMTYASQLFEIKTSPEAIEEANEPRPDVSRGFAIPENVRQLWLELRSLAAERSQLQQEFNKHLSRLPDLPDGADEKTRLAFQKRSALIEAEQLDAIAAITDAGREMESLKEQIVMELIHLGLSRRAAEGFAATGKG